MNVLLVDDTSLYPAILGKSLDEIGVALHIAGNGHEALQVAAMLQFDLVALSMQLGDMDGFFLTKRLRELPAFKHTPIIILTGSASRDVSEKAELSGVTEIFRKQDIEELVHFMRRFLARFRAIQGRVLYVEDNPSQRQVMSAQLQNWGLQVDAVPNADVGWTYFMGGDYDLVITDIVLDGRMSGSRFVNRIRRQAGPPGDVPILAVTAFDTAARRIELFHLGVSDYVTKPVLPEELYSRIQSLISIKQIADRDRQLCLAIEKAEQASRAKSVFLANMSHEIRTPMNAIMGLTALALRHADDPKLKDQLRKVEQASRHLLSVINDILDLSKIEAGRMTLEDAGFILGDVMENTRGLIAYRATEKGLGIRLALAPATAKLPLMGDPHRLEQILLNLAGNAVKFTEAGSITLVAALAHEDEDEALVRFEVRDTGIGIAPEDQARVFTAFEQADDSTTRKHGGTGLGLAISKRLVHMMSGEIGVESQIGQGSTFWFSARFRKSLASVETPDLDGNFTAEDRLKTDYRGTRILLAEDEPINQEVSRGLLEDVGMVVDLAEDGEVALGLARRASYDLILMDMQMPNLNGLDATRAIRALPLYANTPILAMTANAFHEDRQACIAAGMNDHISKPIDPDVLFDTLLKWLSQGR